MGRLDNLTGCGLFDLKGDLYVYAILHDFSIFNRSALVLNVDRADVLNGFGGVINGILGRVFPTLVGIGEDFYNF